MFYNLKNNSEIESETIIEDEEKDKLINYK